MKHKDINELDKWIESLLEQFKKSLLEENEKIGVEINAEVRNRINIPDKVRNKRQFLEYWASIQNKTEKEDDEKITTTIFSDLVCGGLTKWANVPVGAFFEWGTGPLGENSNEYPHGYPYTTDAPWDYFTWLQKMEEGSWGIRARPHFVPAFEYYKPIYRKRMLEAFEKAWMKLGH